MKLTVNNIDQLLRVELSKSVEFVEVNDNPRGVFLVWASNGDGAFAKQTKTIAEAIKRKIPIIIFDKHQKMDAEEISFMVKEGAFLWEPAVTDRMFFSFQPVWGKVYHRPEDIRWDFEHKRELDFVNVNSLIRKMPSFEKYYVPVHEIGGYSVVCADFDGNQTINDRVDTLDIKRFTPQGDYLKDIKMTLLLGTERDYKTGHLDPNLFTYLENGVIPMIPTEHRWYHSVFGDLVVEAEDDIEFLLKTYNSIAFGCVYEIYQNISENLPEADVVNVAKRIISYLKQ